MADKEDLDLPIKIPWAKSGGQRKEIPPDITFPIDHLKSTDSPYIQDMFIEHDAGEQFIGRIIRVTSPKGYRAEHAPTGATVMKQAKTKVAAITALRTYHHLWSKDPREVWKFRCGICDAQPPRGEPNYKLRCQSCDELVGCKRCMPQCTCEECNKTA
jgi:hypothetical protein